jgi:hypothetical protein
MLLAAAYLQTLDKMLCLLVSQFSLHVWRAAVVCVSMSSCAVPCSHSPLQVLGDFMRILLEVINCILSLNLGRNPELVYALLHRQEVFEQLRPQPGFAELVENLQVGRRAAGAAACVQHGSLMGSKCLGPQCAACLRLKVMPSAMWFAGWQACYVGRLSCLVVAGACRSAQAHTVVGQT